MQGTIVVADRSRTVRRMVEIALARHSLKLEFAGDARSAIDAVQSGGASLALVDPNLPGDGYEAAKGIKSSGGAKVLMLVGRNHSFDAARARSAGSDGHINKPFLTQDLVRAIAEVLGQAEPDKDLFKSGLRNIPLARGGTAQVGGAPARPASRPAAAINKPSSAPPRRTQAKPAAAPAPPPLKKAAPPPAAAARKPAPPAKPAAPARSAPPPARAAVDAAVQAAASKVGADLQLSQALAGASREVVEQIAWEVIPKLAEAILKEEIARVVRERMAAS